jgi:hypothetical protein
MALKTSNKNRKKHNIEKAKKEIEKHTMKDDTLIKILSGIVILVVIIAVI